MCKVNTTRSIKPWQPETRHQRRGFDIFCLTYFKLRAFAQSTLVHLPGQIKIDVPRSGGYKNCHPVYLPRAYDALSSTSSKSVGSNFAEYFSLIGLSEADQSNTLRELVRNVNSSKSIFLFSFNSKISSDKTPPDR